jgi:hypothetical protein
VGDWPDGEPLTDTPSLSELPPYLRRYLETRFGYLGQLSSAEDYELAVDYALTWRHETGLKYLRQTVDRLRFVHLTLDELLQALRRIEDAQAPSLLIGEVQDRLRLLTAQQADRIAAVLSELSQETLNPAGRVAVDRAVQRLLPLLQSTCGRELAAASLDSSRVLRRRAAYKFFRVHGLTEQARTVLRRQLQDGMLEAPDLISTDLELVAEFGLGRVLELAPGTYHRMRAIGIAMSFLPPGDVAEICLDYPQELVWAVHEGRRKEYLPHLLYLLDHHRSDVYLLNRIVGCIGLIGHSEHCLEAVAVSDQILKQVGETSDT